jgi:hypothetical protein
MAPNNPPRIVGINNMLFAVHDDYRTYRRNVIYKSQQFQQILERMNIKCDSFFDVVNNQTVIYDLFEQHRSRLTDLVEEDRGYY